MRTSTASFLTVLLGASQALATCVEGHREEISPDYTVEYKCNYYRAGKIHKNIGSATECAALAKDQGAIASTYHITKKQCLVADPEGAKEGPTQGTIFMVKVEDEEPFPEEPEEPFPTTAEEDRDACLEREAALKKELGTCQTGSAGAAADSTLAKELIASSCPGQHNKYGVIGGKEYKFWCHRYHNLNNVKETHQKVNTMLDCVKLCNARSWCKHVVHGVYETTCRLYAWDISHATVPGLDSLALNAAVLKGLAPN